MYVPHAILFANAFLRDDDNTQVHAAEENAFRRAACDAG